MISCWHDSNVRPSYTYTRAHTCIQDGDIIPLAAVSMSPPPPPSLKKEIL
jgi:hypothetical protein